MKQNRSLLLLELTGAQQDFAREVAPQRPAVAAAIGGDPQEVERALTSEQAAERRSDREYWKPLKAELGQFRQRRLS